MSRRGWGWKNFLAEANEGVGLKFPAWLHPLDAFRCAGAGSGDPCYGLGAHRQLLDVSKATGA